MEPGNCARPRFPRALLHPRLTRAVRPPRNPPLATPRTAENQQSGKMRTADCDKPLAELIQNPNGMRRFVEVHIRLSRKPRCRTGWPRWSVRPPRPVAVGRSSRGVASTPDHAETRASANAAAPHGRPQPPQHDDRLAPAQRWGPTGHKATMKRNGRTENPLPRSACPTSLDTWSTASMPTFSARSRRRSS